ncbi:MAG TPA: DUF3817 domain-containing protein [Motilibacteraceae bacterium]|nr:DUF3817 domain-containing protein [Motilibacteraceae bacterium]
MTAPASPTTTARAPRALGFYRVLAYSTGVVLAVQTFFGLPAKYLFHASGGLATAIGLGWMLHGYLYMAYVVSVLWLTTQLRWKPVRAVLVMLAGTVPLASFVAERSVVREVHARAARKAARRESAPRAAAPAADTGA